MHKMILVSAALMAMLVLAGCASQGTGSASNASGGHIVPTVQNASSQQPSQTFGNATANTTPAQNNTPPVINQAPNNSAAQCAYVAPPSAEQQAACKKNASAYVEIKDAANCTTAYACMDAVSRVRYDLSRIHIQDKICPPVITSDIIYAAANTCGAEYDTISVVTTSTYAYINGSTCAKSISINCTSIGTFVRSTQ